MQVYNSCLGDWSKKISRGLSQLQSEAKDYLPLDFEILSQNYKKNEKNKMSRMRLDTYLRHTVSNMWKALSLILCTETKSQEI